MTAATIGPTQISVLGPIQVWSEGRAVDLGTPRQRSILAALALSVGRTVPLELLVTRVWPEEAPATAVSTLQRYVASLRRAVEPDRAPHEPPSVIVTDGGGYVLRVPSASRDVAVLEAAVAEARTLLADVPDLLRPQIAASRTSHAVRATEAVQRALGLWRGEPYADLGDDPDAAAERARLEDLRTAARELNVVALMSLGRHTEVVGELEAMTALHPLHERWWALYAVALVRSGRQAEALQALGTVRSLLADELGVDPSGPLRDLHTAILRQDPSLEWASAPAPAPRLQRMPAPKAEPAAFVPRWPLAGRSVELGVLRGLLDGSRERRGSVALVTGESGVGKTRLVQELSLAAHADGVVVVTTACSQQSPPALWPLRVVLTTLARRLPSFDVDTGPIDTQPDEFRTRQQVADLVVEAAQQAPLLVVVEDVQWADRATLQVLEDLVTRCATAPLLLVLTRRTDAGDGAAITRLAASVARTDGARIDLEGLSLDETAELVHAVDDAVADVRQLWRRSGGNPFFAVELALSGGALSGSLTDVVHSRVTSLPPETLTALRAASVLDLAFDVRLLALMLGRDEREAVDLLGPATGAGLVVEHAEGDATHAFSHAVLREVVYAEQTQPARAAWHAAAARALTDRGDLRRVDQRASLLHHWEHAGRSAAGAAWRGVLTAATHARADTAYAEEARYLRRAAALLDQDLDADDREGFEMLMLVADACRWSGDWSGLSDAVDHAIVVAERLDDHALAARAAISVAEGALRHVRPFGHVHAPIVDALERLLLRLGDEDASLRCRTQVALAMELYFDPHQTARIDALVEDAVRFAEHTEDLRLQFTAYHGAFVATWRLDTVERRAAIAARALDVARRLDDPRALVFGETLALAVASELGDAPRVRAGLDRVIALAQRRGLTIPEGVLRVLALSWAGMRGDQDAVREQAGALEDVMSHAGSFVATVSGTVVTSALLTGDLEALQSAIAGFVPEEGFPTELIGATLLIRFGRVDDARDLVSGAEIELSTHTFLGVLNAALACHVAAAVGATRLTEDACAYLRPHAGRMCSAAAAAAIGPVDLHLALGAHALGDPVAARRHLDDAARLIEAWSLPGMEPELAHVRAVLDSPPPTSPAPS